MKIIYVLWGYEYDEEIIEQFERENLIVEKVITDNKIFIESTSSIDKKDEKKEKYLEDLKEKIISKITDHCKDIVFSINYSSYISEQCKYYNIKYFSWVLKLPNIDLYTKEIYNGDMLAINDTYLVEVLYKKGIKKVFFLPDATIIDDEYCNANDLERGICFIEKQPKNNLNLEELTLYSRGYLDAFLHSQRVLSGEFVLDKYLINRIYIELEQKNSIPEYILPSLKKLFIADYYFAPKSTLYHQNIVLQNIDTILEIYSDSDFFMCNCRKDKFITDEKVRRMIYSKKEFVLILPQFVYHNAIPKQFLDVIGAGGFPITSYQKDYDYFGENEKNIIYFKNKSEFDSLIIKYGNDLELREQLLMKMRKIVEEKFTYKVRIKEIVKLMKNNDRG